MEYKYYFTLPEAYEFLRQNSLDKECEEIKSSSDRFKSYDSTLRRAKIVVLVKRKKLFETFCKQVWPSGLTEKGERRTKFFENLIARFNADQEGTLMEEEEEVHSAEENEFAYEDDLRNYLVKNLGIIEKGLTLYKTEDGITGEEFFIPGTSRRIDILAIDANKYPVVIELKVSRGHDRVIGQALYYQSMMKTLFKKENVRIIIIAREILAELKIATQSLKDVELFEYQLSITLDKIER